MGILIAFPEHRSLLLELKHGFTLFLGQLASWEPSSNCCGWEGITCDPKSGHVIRLDLSGRKIVGGINSHALFGLTSLQTLNLSNNLFDGIPISIPEPGFENLKELRQLDLSNGGFVGQIPNGISRLARLEYLDLSGCCVTVNGHYSFGGSQLEMRNPNFSRMIRNLNNLRVLKLGCVDLHQDPEWVTALVTSVPHLQVLDLGSTNLTGLGDQIANGITRLARLEYLDLSVCYPSSFGSLELRNPNFSNMIRNLNNLRVLKLACVDLGQDVERVTAALVTSAPHLQVLHLSVTNLTGTIPESFANLKNLTEVVLPGNKLTGVIPASIGKLVKLTLLDLSDNSLMGPVPGSLFSLPLLQSLYLMSNQLSGELDVSLNASTSLKEIDLSYNQLCGQIPPTFFYLPSLETLALGSNNFSGAIELDRNLAGNKLTGVIPASIGKLVKLTLLDLSGNSLTGPVPGSLFSLPLLQRLTLNFNQLSGELDVSLNASTSLMNIDLSNNQLCGQIPPTFFYLPSLETLALGSNNFSGAIELDRNLAGNKLTGVIPASIGKLLKLTLLDLSDNSLTGPVPGSLFFLPSLQSLYLMYNQLSGELDVSLNASTSLKEIDLSNNQLCGEIPQSLFYLPSLERLNLGSNNFSGAIELDRIANLNNLTTLDLSNNGLSVGEFDDNNFLSLPNLRELSLASCGLTKVPTFLKNQKNIDFLDLSNNRIGPDIPRWMWSSIWESLDLSHNRFKNIEGLEDMHMSTLESLDLSSNMLHGPIPIPPPFVDYVDFSNNNFSSAIAPEFFNLSRMQTFLAANNNLSGEIPPSICNAISLGVLDISNNLFSGSIPSCLLESDSLAGLNLGRNMLEGIIPQNITRRCMIDSLILSDNHLEGSLPRSLVNCGSLRVLDLGNNHIVDTFPFWLGDHVSLQVLSLRSNRFYGPLGLTERREANYTFPQLRVFDLSSNNFSGKLSPICFSGLRLMMDMLNSARSPLYTPGNVYPSSFYEINIVVIKGQEIQLLNILYTVVDFSNNSFEGDIPPVIGGLQGLHVLNLSHNSLTGNIPFELGNLTQLQSLDLSTNHLSGEIPQCLTSLTFLEWLNLSNNNLAGRIPQDRQFSTFSNASFQQNPELCGIPLSKHCGNAIPNITNAMPPAVISDHSSSLSSYVIGLALSIGIGYGVGLALVIVLVNTRLKFLIE